MCFDSGGQSKSMVYFTSDLHFYHEKIIKHTQRPFHTVEEMNKALIKNWNDKISSADEVYILGDFTMKGADLASALLYSLKGKNILYGEIMINSWTNLDLTGHCLQRFRIIWKSLIEIQILYCFIIRLSSGTVMEGERSHCTGISIIIRTTTSKIRKMAYCDMMLGLMQII